MKKFYKITLLVITAAIFMTTTALAVSSYQIDWWTMDGGGGTSQGGDYTLQGTIGQPDIGSPQGGEYSLEGGFWAGIIDWIRQFFIHLPLVLR